MRRNVNIWARIDWLTILLYLLMIFLGWINIYASAFNEEHVSILDLSQRYGKQILWIGAALLLAVIVIMLDSRFYTGFSYVLYGFLILMLIAVLLAGTTIHGSRSWFSFGPVNLQPSEFAKFATALALAKYLSDRSQNLNNFRSVLGALFIIFTPAVLIMLQPDMGSTVIFIVFIVVLYREGLSALLLFTGFYAVVLFLCTLLFDTLWVMLITLLLASLVYLLSDRVFKRFFWGLIIPALFFGLVYGLTYLTDKSVETEILLAGALFLSALVFIPVAVSRKLPLVFWVYGFALASLFFILSADYVFHEILESHQQTRINILLGIESDPFGKGYNVNQSLIAIGSGGFSGKGFLNGTQTKFNFVPEQSTDFIFCTVGEEWGFIGAAVVILLFLVLLLRIIFLAERQRSTFSRVYGYSVFAVLAFHFIINIGMTIGLIPVIGIPLPFFSYGGSSLWAFTLLLFIFLRLDASRAEYLV